MAAALRHEGHLPGHVVDGRGEEVDAERLLGPLSDPGRLAPQAPVVEGRGPEAAEPAGLRDGRDELVVGDAAHPRERHGVVDAEELG